MTRLLALALTLAASQASALSCMRPDPIRALQYAVADTEPWIVLEGRLDYATDWLPPSPDKPRPEGALPVIEATLTGAALSTGGFVSPFVGRVLLQPSCAGPWCGGLPGTGDRLLFARLDPQGTPVVTLDACAQWVFPPASPALAAALAGCLAGGRCGSQ